MIDTETHVTAEEDCAEDPVRAFLDGQDVLQQVHEALYNRMIETPGKYIAAIAACIPLVILSVFLAASYIHYSRLIDKRLHGGAFPDSVNIYAAPLSLSVGDPADASDLITELRTDGYEESTSPVPGSW